MMTGMMADKYMAKFEMLSGQTSFNEGTGRRHSIWGLPQLILSKGTPRPHYIMLGQLEDSHAQTGLPPSGIPLN